MITAPTETDADANTHFIDPRVSIALDIICQVCDQHEDFVQDMLREEQGFKASLNFTFGGLLSFLIMLFLFALFLYRNQASLHN